MTWTPGPGGLPLTDERKVPPEWTDYNGHMNEAHYLTVAASATDMFLALIGAGTDYVAAGKSYFTAETHIRYLAEVDAGDVLLTTTQVLGRDGRKLHLFHRLWRAGDTLAATVETLLLHVDLTTRRTCQPDTVIKNRVRTFVDSSANIPAEGAGRHVGQRAS